MAKVVTMGEIMLRLSPPGYQRFAQASEFEINYGGAEANVAVSLAQLGHDVTYISKIPSNAIGEAAIATLKKTGVDCRYIARGGKRLGVYFLENGASVRPSNVVYDRADSSITQASAEEFDFDQIFDGVDLAGFEIVRHLVQFFQIADLGFLRIGFGITHIEISLQRNDNGIGLRFVKFSLDFFDGFKQRRQVLTQIADKGVGSSDPTIELALFGLDAFLLHSSDGGTFMSSG